MDLRIVLSDLLQRSYFLTLEFAELIFSLCSSVGTSAAADLAFFFFAFSFILLGGIVEAEAVFIVVVVERLEMVGLDVDVSS